MFVTPVSAQTTDSGEVVVTATVGPRATSVTTSIDATAASDPVHQEQEITYTVTYGSTNSSSVPLEFGVSWDKGTIDGASEASVESLEYVVGSASSAYGNTAAVVDTKNRSISWSISALPGNTTNQQVNFKLRTTSNYSGSKTVSMPVKVFVVSPVGVPDRSITREYQYVESEESTSTVTSSPMPVPSPETSALVGSDIFRSIELRSLGSISARILVDTKIPISTKLSYGQSVGFLGNAQLQSPSDKPQEFVLTNLQPSTRYYFQASTADGAIESDVFTFETSDHPPIELGDIPPTVTFTQDRTIIYSGSAPNGPGETAQPIVVTKNSVFDLSLQIPKNEQIHIVEVLIRNFGVLGASTEALDSVDDLQSSTTKMTKISNDLYVGKLRTPVRAGNYAVISRIEDDYGNVLEQELGSMRVVVPFGVFDKNSKNPLENAQVTLELYNLQTKLYERLSNVTTAITNPTYSDLKGIVHLSLFPGKYKAIVRLAGYQTQEVEFEMGTDAFTNMPQVYLTPKHSILGAKVAYAWGSFSYALDGQINWFSAVGKSHRIFGLVLIISTILFVIATATALLLFRHPEWDPDIWLLRYKQKPWSKFVIWPIYFLIQIIRFCGEFFVALNILFGVAFYMQLGPQEGGVILLITSVLIGIWCVDFMFLKTHHKTNNTKEIEPLEKTE